MALISEMSAEMKVKVANGSITWKQAAAEAQQVRNIIMESTRRRSTPVGRAMSESLKKTGKTLPELIGKYTNDLYGNVNFQTLTIQQQNNVYKAIVESSGRSRPAVNAKMRNFSRAGKGLIIFSLAISTYNILTAEDKTSAIKREAVVTGSGVMGGIVGGGAAGLVCGPAAPVCVTIGAFVGGTLAAFGVDYFFF